MSRIFFNLNVNDVNAEQSKAIIDRINLLNNIGEASFFVGGLVGIFGIYYFVEDDYLKNKRICEKETKNFLCRYTPLEFLKIVGVSIVSIASFPVCGVLFRTLFGAYISVFFHKLVPYSGNADPLIKIIFKNGFKN